MRCHAAGESSERRSARRSQRAWNGEPVQLYALADLDHTLKLERAWLALGANHVAIARRPRTARGRSRASSASRVRSLRDVPGLSANTLLILGDEGAAPLLVVRYTQRQRAAVENIRFVLDEALTGRSVTLDDADRVYADAVARPVRDAQALVAGRESRGDASGCSATSRRTVAR